jgi:hypothetical protein
MGIGSDKARVWSRELPLRNCSAKAIMLAMSNYVDERGYCSPSIAALASDTDQSAATVRRRLHWLQNLGVLGLFPQWIDENGRLNQDGRGRRTQDEIRFIMSVDIAALAARVDAEKRSSEEAETEDDGAEPASLQGSDPITADPPNLQGSDLTLSPVQGSDPPKLCKGILYEEPFKKDSPQSPPQTEAEGEGKGTPASEPDEQGLRSFQADYPRPSTKPGLVHTRWLAMTPDERIRARRGARGVRAVWEEDRKRRPAIVDQAKFLGDPALWDEWGRHAPPEPKVRRFVAFDSPEWLARVVLREILGRPAAKPEMTTAGLGIMVSGDLPSGLLELATYANSDPATWLTATTGTAQFTAWGERIKPIIGNWPEARRIRGEGTTTINVNGTPREMPNWLIGLPVPCEWPPPKHGTGPPTQPSHDEGNNQNDQVTEQEGTKC